MMDIVTDPLIAARAQFPITRNLIYLDSANMNSPPDCVTQTLADYYTAMQTHGGDKRAWGATVAATRAKAAQLLGCDTGEVAFCKNTSEGINIAANAIDWRPGDNVVLPASEHPNNVFPWLNLRRHGVEVRMIPQSENWVGPDLLGPHIDSRTRVVAVADVSFHPGQRNDLPGLAELCHRVGAHLVVDGVQAVGLRDVDLRNSGIAMWAASGHKGLLCPHGIGLFYCRSDLIPALAPAYAARASMVSAPGDDHVVREIDVPFAPDAQRFEIGNHNYSGIYAMGAALDLLLGVGIRTIEQHIATMAAHLTDRLAALGVSRLGPADPRRWSSICAYALPGDGWVEYLAANNVIVSDRLGGLRASLGVHNNIEDLDNFVEILSRRLKP